MLVGVMERVNLVGWSNLAEEMPLSTMERVAIVMRLVLLFMGGVRVYVLMR